MIDATFACCTFTVDKEQSRIIVYKNKKSLQQMMQQIESSWQEDVTRVAELSLVVIFV